MAYPPEITDGWVVLNMYGTSIPIGMDDAEPATRLDHEKPNLAAQDAGSYRALMPLVEVS